MEAKTKTQLALEMGISLRTLQRKLKLAELNIPRGLISPKLQQEIFEKLGWQQKRRVIAQNGVK